MSETSTMSLWEANEIGYPLSPPQPPPVDLDYEVGKDVGGGGEGMMRCYRGKKGEKDASLEENSRVFGGSGGGGGTKQALARRG